MSGIFNCQFLMLDFSFLFQQMTEQDLQNNRILDDLVVNFQAARLGTARIKYEGTISCQEKNMKAYLCNKESMKTPTSFLNVFYYLTEPAQLWSLDQNNLYCFRQT